MRVMKLASTIALATASFAALMAFTTVEASPTPVARHPVPHCVREALTMDGSNTFFKAPKALAEALATRALGSADTSLHDDHPDVCCKCDPFCCDPLCCDTKAETEAKRSLDAIASLEGGPIVLRDLVQRNLTSPQAPTDGRCFCGLYILDESCCGKSEAKIRDIVDGFAKRAVLHASLRHVQHSLDPVKVVKKRDAFEAPIEEAKMERAVGLDKGQGAGHA